ncbi:MAG TPA: hypothetical protein VLD39_08155 [Gammaproteobacteria bacterium]|nr:hypothetical protein [Gammaproteobacteria bacterium]
MTRRGVHALSRETLERNYPIADRVPNWCFRVVEISNDAWRVEGCDVWGRKVAHVGSNPESLLASCIADAHAIAAEAQ